VTTSLLLEGEDLEALLVRAHQEGGANARIVRAEKVRQGGFLGFFARERFEVAVEIPQPPGPELPGGPESPGPRRGTAVTAGPDGPAVAAAPGAPGTAAPSGGTGSERGLMALVDRVSARERGSGASTEPVGPRQGPPDGDGTGTGAVGPARPGTVPSSPAEADAAGERPEFTALLDRLRATRAPGIAAEAVIGRPAGVADPAGEPAVATVPSTGGPAVIAMPPAPAGAGTVPSTQDPAALSPVFTMGRTALAVPSPRTPPAPAARAAASRTAGAALAGPGGPAGPPASPFPPAGREGNGRGTGAGGGGGAVPRPRSAAGASGGIPARAAVAFENAPRRSASTVRPAPFGGALGPRGTGPGPLGTSPGAPGTHPGSPRTSPGPLGAVPGPFGAVPTQRAVPVPRVPAAGPRRDAVGTAQVPPVPPRLREATITASVRGDMRSAADRKRLRSLGVPAAWTRQLRGGDRFAAVLRMLERMPDVEADPDAAVVAVVGPPGVALLEAHRTAVELAAGDRPRPVVPVPTTVVGGPRGSAIAQVHREPCVVAVEVPRDGSVTGVREVIQAVTAQVVIVVVDAGDPVEHVQTWVDALDQVDAVVVNGAGTSREPMAALQLGLPVIRLDGIPVDRVTWAALMCARLEAMEPVL